VSLLGLLARGRARLDVLLARGRARFDGGPWNAPHHPARPLLLSRGLYALLALDAWALML
jgi:hypothetical protein